MRLGCLQSNSRKVKKKKGKISQWGIKNSNLTRRKKMSQWEPRTAQGIRIRGKLDAFENHSFCPASIFWLGIGIPHFLAVFVSPRFVIGLDESRNKSWSKTEPNKSWCNDLMLLQESIKTDRGKESIRSYLCPTLPIAGTLPRSPDSSSTIPSCVSPFCPLPSSHTWTLRSWTMPDSLWPESPCTHQSLCPSGPSYPNGPSLFFSL